jgi:N-acylglucosamine 2-epimerase
MTGLNRRGEIIDTDKGVWQQGRFAWMMAWLYNHVAAREEWLAMAKGTLDFIERHGYDTDGRMFFHLTREGAPVRKRRYAFSESFACIAAAEYARATKDARYADLALKTYRFFGDFAETPPKFTSNRPARGLGHPMINIATCQCLREAIGFEEADARIDRAIEDIARYHVKDDLRVVMETVAPDGSIIDHAAERMNNPGHAIEGAWFILEEGRRRDRADYVDLGLRMLTYSWERGWDPEYGGIFYYRDVYNHPVSEYWQDMKFWWPHNEAVLATLLAHLITGDPVWEARHREVHEWSYAHFPDPEYGDWFGYLARDGRVTSDVKGNLFKGSFHLPRMQAYCCEFLSR